MKLGKNISDKIYEVLDKDDNIIPNIVGKKYKNMKDLGLEYSNLIRIKYIPNTTNLISIDSKNSILYLEKIKGKELYKVLEDRNFDMSEFEARNIIKQLIVIMQNLIDIELFHSDIKLENIMYNEITGEIFLIDFEKNRYTYDYLPPEFYDKKYYKTNDKTYSWFLGVITYTLLNGHLPFNDKNHLLKYDKYKIKVNISDLAHDFINKTLEKNKKKRIIFNDIKKHPWIIDNFDKNKGNFFKKIVSYLV